jgi:hypothetical protein
MSGIFWSSEVFDPQGDPDESPANHEGAKRLALAGKRLATGDGLTAVEPSTPVDHFRDRLSFLPAALAWRNPTSGSKVRAQIWGTRSSFTGLEI